MDKSTKALSKIIADQGITVKHLSKKTGIPYYILHKSLSPDKAKRSLRADECLEVCKTLNIDPLILLESYQ